MHLSFVVVIFFQMSGISGLVSFDNRTKSRIVERLDIVNVQELEDENENALSVLVNVSNVSFISTSVNQWALRLKHGGTLRAMSELHRVSTVVVSVALFLFRSGIIMGYY